MPFNIFDLKVKIDRLQLGELVTQTALKTYITTKLGWKLLEGTDNVYTYHETDCLSRIVFPIEDYPNIFRWSDLVSSAFDTLESTHERLNHLTIFHEIFTLQIGEVVVEVESELTDEEIEKIRLEKELVEYKKLEEELDDGTLRI